MPGEAINIGRIYADLDVNSGNMVRGLAQGEKAVRLITAELRTLDEQLKAGAIDMGTYLSRVAQLDLAAGSIEAKMKVANAAVNAHASAIDILNGKIQAAGGSMGQGSHAANRFAQGLMQLGYVVDDLQYGFSSVVNNIAPLVHGLGGSAGLAVAAQVAAVAANQLYNNWDKVKAAFGENTALNESTRSVEGLTKKIKELKEELESLPRAHTAVALDVAEKDLKAREETEAAAKKMDKDVEPQEKKERERHVQAVQEGGGVEKIAEKIGNRDFNNAMTGKLGHISQFLTSADYEQLQIRKKLADTSGKINDFEKFNLKNRLNQDSIARGGVGVEFGADFDEQNAGFIKGLEEKARAKAKEEARNFLARGAMSKGGRDLVKEDALAHPEDYGKETADVLTGNGFTKKELAEADERTAEYARKDKELRKGQVKNFIERAVPNLKSISDHLAAKQDRGEIDEATRREKLKDEMWVGNLPDVISVEELDRSVQAEIDRTAEEDPKKRGDRLKHEAAAKAREAVPDIQHRADRAAHDVERGVTTGAAARHGLTSLLTGKGLSDDEAKSALETEDARLEKEGPVKRSARLKRESLSKAEEIVPDVSDSVESAIARGIDPDTIKRGLQDRLQQGGMGSTEATETASTLFGRGQESVRERLANLASGQQAPRSEVTATSQLTQKVQAGVGAGEKSEGKKTNDLLEKQRVLLEKIASKSAVQLELR